MTHGAADELEIAHVQPYQAVKTYRCPGCDHEIAARARPRGRGAARRARATGATGTPAAGAAPSVSGREPASPARAQNAASSTSITAARCPAPRRTEATSKRSSGARALGMLRRATGARGVRSRRCFVAVTASNGAPNADAAAGLHLAEHEHGAARATHEVELAFAAAPVAVERRRSRAAAYQRRDRVLTGHAPSDTRGGSAGTVRGPWRVPRC